MLTRESAQEILAYLTSNLTPADYNGWQSPNPHPGYPLKSYIEGKEAAYPELGITLQFQGWERPIRVIVGYREGNLIAETRWALKRPDPKLLGLVPLHPAKPFRPLTCRRCRVKSDEYSLIHSTYLEEGRGGSLAYCPNCNRGSDDYVPGSWFIM